MLTTFFLTINDWITSATYLAALGCFLWGMVSVLFSPCHLASIPLVVAYVAGQEQLLKPRQAAHYAVLFTAGLFITIAVIGVVCALLGRMLGDVGAYWQIPVGAESLWGGLTFPAGEASGMVIFAHGSGSSRMSPRNRFVAEKLRETGTATFLFDLLTEREDAVYENRFDITLLTERLILATGSIRSEPQTRGLKIGYFGASTGAAAALRAAADLGPAVDAVVSRGGRPDMAEVAMERVRTPTLLIVGGFDDVVITLNQQAYDRLRCPKDLKIVPGATHLFEESGTLEEVARLASDWFLRHLAAE